MRVQLCRASRRCNARLQFQHLLERAHREAAEDARRRIASAIPAKAGRGPDFIARYSANSGVRASCSGVVKIEPIGKRVGAEHRVETAAVDDRQRIQQHLRLESGLIQRAVVDRVLDQRAAGRDQAARRSPAFRPAAGHGCSAGRWPARRGCPTGPPRPTPPAWRASIRCGC